MQSVFYELYGGAYMDLLKQKILNEGRVITEEILKVDAFLNHQIDPFLTRELGREFARRFSDTNPTKILTIEASGIAVAVMTGLEMNVPVVFAKKAKPGTITEGIYSTRVKSFTKGAEYEICVSSSYLKQNDRVLVIDDFLARGNSMMGLLDILDKSGSSLEGVGIVIEKGFQGGGQILRRKGIRVESLAVIKNMRDGMISFC